MGFESPQHIAAHHVAQVMVHAAHVITMCWSRTVRAGSGHPADERRWSGTFADPPYPARRCPLAVMRGRPGSRARVHEHARRWRGRVRMFVLARRGRDAARPPEHTYRRVGVRRLQRQGRSRSVDGGIGPPSSRRLRALGPSINRGLVCAQMARFGARREASQTCHENLRHKAGQRGYLRSATRGWPPGSLGRGPSEQSADLNIYTWSANATRHDLPCSACGFHPVPGST